MTDLHWYPKPEINTGCGMHDSANKYASPSDLTRHARQLQQRGITWYKLLCDGTNKVDRAKIYKDHGIEPIIRLFAHGPHPKFKPDPVILQAYKDVGVSYVEWGNEPNIGDIEWSNWPGTYKAPLRVAEQAHACHSIIKDAGMIPMFVALTPGGYINHRQFYIECVGEIIKRGWQDIFNESALAVHPRPLNHPPSMNPEYKSPEELGRPSMDTGLREVEWIHDFFIEAIGWCPPMIATEAGYSIGSAEDANFPRIDEQLHYQYNRIMFEMHRDYWPDSGDYFMASCYWLESIGSNWPHDTLWANWVGSQPKNKFARWLDSGGIDWTLEDSEGSQPPDTQPEPHAFEIYDIDGNQQGKAWLDITWGIDIEFGDGPYKLTELREQEGPATQEVRVRGPNNQPEDGIIVFRSWPSGSTSARTVNGKVGFGLGRGDYITGPGKGVSSVWVYGDRVHKLGMVAGTEHRTLRVTFQYQTDTLPVPETPIEEVVREHAYRTGGIPYNPDAAFPKFARENSIGNPVTREFDFIINGVHYRGQGFGQGIVYTVEGEWNNMKVVEW